MRKSYLVVAALVAVAVGVAYAAVKHDTWNASSKFKPFSLGVNESTYTNYTVGTVDYQRWTSHNWSGITADGNGGVSLRIEDWAQGYQYDNSTFDSSSWYTNETAIIWLNKKGEEVGAVKVTNYQPVDGWYTNLGASTSWTWIGNVSPSASQLAYAKYVNTETVVSTNYVPSVILYGQWFYDNSRYDDSTVVEIVNLKKNGKSSVLATLTLDKQYDSDDMLFTNLNASAITDQWIDVLAIQPNLIVYLKGTDTTKTVAVSPFKQETSTTIEVVALKKNGNDKTWTATSSVEQFDANQDHPDVVAGGLAKPDKQGCFATRRAGPAKTDAYELIRLDFKK